MAEQTRPFRHSPLQLRVLLHYHFSPVDWADAEADSKPAKEAIAYWQVEGCLQSVAIKAGQFAAMRITDRGRAMVEMWLRQPIPQLKSFYVDSAGQPIELSWSAQPQGN